MKRPFAPASVDTPLPTAESAAGDPRSAEASEPVAATYRPALDGIRGLAFLLVFLLHALVSLGPVLAPYRQSSILVAALLEVGREGVPLFFVLSAFLVTTILLGERRSTGSIDVRAFLARRALRLLPLYYLLLLVTAPVFASFTRGYPWYLVVCGDFFHMLNGTAFTGGSLVFLWSIGVEEKFYLVWSAALARIATDRVATVAWATVGAAWLYRFSVAPFVPWRFIGYSLFGYLDCFALGILAAVGRLSPPRIFGYRLGGFAALALYLLGLVVAKALSWTIGAGVPVSNFGESLSTGLCALLSISLLLSVKDDVRGWAVWSPLRSIGKISYGAYLFHTFVLIGIAHLPFPPASAPALIGKVAALGITLALATLSYRYIESPFLRLKSRFRPAGVETGESSRS